jgi:hypothetical protein
LVLVFALPAAQRAFAEVVTVSFEEAVAFPDAIRSQYCDQGIDFINTARIVTPTVTTSSPTHVLTNRFFAQEFGENNTIRASFTVAQDSVSVDVGLDQAHATPVEARLWGFSSDTPQAGYLVDFDAIDLGQGPTPITRTLTVTAAPATIRSIMVEFIRPTNLYAYEWIDDLRFTRGPPCGVADNTAPVVRITQPAVAGSVTHVHSQELAYTVDDDHSVAAVQVSLTDAGDNEIQSFYACGGPASPPCQAPLDAESGDFYTYLPAGTRQIRVKAWDYANNEGSDYQTIELQLPGPDYNLWVQALEITQGIQPWLPTNPLRRSGTTPGFSYPDVNTGYDAVPLVAGRKTVARLFAGVEDTLDDVPLTGATAALRCFRGLAHQPCPGPQSIAPEIDPVLFRNGLTLYPGDALDDRRRDQLLSFNFVLPRAWTEAGEIVLEARLHPPGDAPECGGCEDGANRIRVSKVRFNSVPDFSDELAQLVVIERTLNAVKTKPSQANIERAARFIRDIYPVDETTISTKNLPVVAFTDFDHTTYPQDEQGKKHKERCDSVRTKLYQQYPAKNGKLSVNAVIDSGFPCAGLGGGDGYSYSNETRPSTVAHEMGHSVGLSHAGPKPGHSSFCPNPDGSDCAECRPSSGGCDADYPYPHGNIGAFGFDVFAMGPVPDIHADCITPDTCDNKLNEDGDFWMRDTDGDGIAETAVFAKVDDDPAGGGGTDLTNHPHDFMSYGDISDWISPRNWTRLYNAFTGGSLPYKRNAAAAAPPVPASTASTAPLPAAASDRILMLGGVLDEVDGWRLGPAFEMDVAQPLPAGVSGDYFVRFRDLSGSLLGEHRFAVEQHHFDLPGDDFLTILPAPLRFSERVPLPAAAATLEFGYRDDLLVSRTRSGMAPTIAILSPDTGGLHGSPQGPLVSWTSSDSDSPALFHIVQYSRDAGVTWQTLGSGISGDHLAVDPAALGGSSQATVRVLASDGFNTTPAQSPPFTVDDKPPLVEILSPEAPLVIERHQVFSLLGTAHDVEDGLVDAADLAWSSTIDGVFGHGRQVNLDVLSAGVHEISLFAEDSQGQQGSDVIVVTVNAPLNRQPTADAGPDRLVAVGDELTIDGSASRDPDGDALAYAWHAVAKPAGSNPVFTSDDSAQAGFIADVAGIYRVGLGVHDGSVGSVVDTLTVEALGPGTDTDGDGMPDLYEIDNDLDRLVDDADDDSDHDGTANLVEMEKGTDPRDPRSYPTTPAVNPVIEKIEAQSYPATAYNPGQDEFFTVWQDDIGRFTVGSGDFGTKIFGRRTGPDGQALFVDIQVSGNEINNATRPDIAHAVAADRYLVVWEHEVTPGNRDIHGRWLAADGTVTGQPFVVASSPRDQANPAVAYDPDANVFAVVWQQETGADEFVHTDILGRLVQGDGSGIGDTVALAAASHNEKTPAIAWGDGRYLLVFAAVHTGDAARADYDISGLLLDAVLAPAAARIDLSTWEHDQLAPRAAFNPGRGEFLVVWEDHHWGWGADSDIYGRRVNGLGAMQDAQFGISCDGSLRFNPDVTYNPDADTYLVVWEYRYAESDHDVFMRRISGTGELLDGETPVSRTGAHERQPVICAGAAGRNLAAWQDERNSAVNDADIYSALVRLPVGTAEVCDGIDNDLDGTADEGFDDHDGDKQADCVDADDDNDGVDDEVELSLLSDPFSAASTPEVCDFVDNDQDGLVDEGFDLDGDGFSVCAGDCADSAAAINPGVSETCDGVDNNCDGRIDEGFDVDRDGFTTCQGDCDDLDPTASPAGTETCDGADNDCNGTVDDAALTDPLCADNNVCNGTEACVGGRCIAGSPLDCNDDNACTGDACDAILGCQHVNIDGPCDDGDRCTRSDTCSAGVCTGIPSCMPELPPSIWILLDD